MITGVGDVFTAGNDLVDFATGASLDEVVRFLTTISSIRVPVVAAVNGLAVGVGLTLLLHCDLVYAEPEAKLWAPFVELGLVPEAASSLLLPRVIGERRASELILCGRRIDGRGAARVGIGQCRGHTRARGCPRSGSTACGTTAGRSAGLKGVTPLRGALGRRSDGGRNEGVR